MHARNALVGGFMILLIGGVGVNPAQAAPEAAPETGSQTTSARGPRLLDFRGQLLMVNNTSGTGYSGAASWNPAYALTDRITAALNLGYSLYSGSVISSYSVLSYGVLGSYRVTDRIAAELGAGAQTWTEQGTFFTAAANAHYLMPTKLFDLIDRAYLGYQAVLAPNTTLEIRVGVGVSL